MKQLLTFLMGLALMASSPAQAIDPEAGCLRTNILKPKQAKKTSITAKDIHLTLQLETVRTPEEREHGLMNRKQIGPCDGMAFFFPSVEPRGVPERFTPQKFWMKNTLIPLDIIFIDETNRITAIVTAEPLSETHVGPDSPTATVIEIDGGRAKKDGITVGDYVFYELANSPSNLAR